MAVQPVGPREHARREALADRITTDRELRHVPVHLISVVVDEAQVDDAVRATHTAFDLDSDEVEAVVYGGSGR